MTGYRISTLVAVAAALLLCSCSSQKATLHGKQGMSELATRDFQVKGVVQAVDPEGKSATIRHEAIPNYMGAMTMPFAVRDPAQVAGLKAGDQVVFRLNVTQTESWIDQVRKLGESSGPPPGAPIRIAKDVEPLEIGDQLPEYHFTNEMGKAISFSQFKGQALAITFIFTRCPLPDFCPRMSGNFAEAQKSLLAASDAPANWRLLTISFDPEFDTPPVLKGYARRYDADPRHWSFLTGDLVEITAIAEQFGQMFWRDQGSLNHNLRTVVVDASGRVKKIFQGNTWTGAELAEELIAAARPAATKP